MPAALRCPSCDAPLDANGLDLRRGIAACDHCGAVTRLDDFAPATDRPSPAVRPAVTRPEKFTVDEHGGVLAVRWRWWSPIYIWMAFFCVLWDGFLLFWYSAAIFGPNLGNGGFDWFFVIFPLGHVAAGVWITYTTLCGWVNRTTLLVDRDLLRVRHEPLPWPGSRDHDPSDFRTLFVREQHSRSSSGRSSGPTYDLLALRGDGGEVKLLTGLDAREKALFLERTIEDHLGLRHEPVAVAVA